MCFSSITWWWYMWAETCELINENTYLCDGSSSIFVCKHYMQISTKRSYKIDPSMLSATVCRCPLPYGPRKDRSNGCMFLGSFLWSVSRTSYHQCAINASRLCRNIWTRESCCQISWLLAEFMMEVMVVTIVTGNIILSRTSSNYSALCILLNKWGIILRILYVCRKLSSSLVSAHLMGGRNQFLRWKHLCCRFCCTQW